MPKTRSTPASANICATISAAVFINRPPFDPWNSRRGGKSPPVTGLCALARVDLLEKALGFEFANQSILGELIRFGRRDIRVGASAIL
jgi:hypothetical protein